MAPRTIGLHVFCSAKGGVGKSTLAVATAKLLAVQGRGCVLVDADMTGTSLADGLRICAPETALDAGGSPDLSKPPTGRHLTRADTVRQLVRRLPLAWDDTGPSPPPPFLNDALRYVRDDGGECRVEALLWRHEGGDEVRYLPSSPARVDILVALGWLYKEEPFAWLQRMTWLFEGMIEQVPALTDIVVDLPPGLFGFAHEMLVFASHIERGEELPSGFPTWAADKVLWKANPLLVTTPDRNDLFAAIDYAVRQREELGRLGLVLNKSTQATMNEVRAAIRERYGDAFAPIELSPVGEMRSTLGEVFMRGTMGITDDVRALGKALRIEEQAR